MRRQVHHIACDLCMAAGFNPSGYLDHEDTRAGKCRYEYYLKDAARIYRIESPVLGVTVEEIFRCRN